MIDGSLGSPWTVNREPVYINGLKIEYKNLMEVCMGGPEIGRLYINDVCIPLDIFGGPFLLDGYFLYAPCRRKCGFVLAKIDLINEYFPRTIIGKPEGVICLEKVHENRIYFYSVELGNKNQGYKKILKFFDMNDPVISSEKDTPLDYTTHLSIVNNTIEYTNLTIRGKGDKRMQLGSLTINGKNISDYMFGGPCLYNESFLYAPVYRHSLWKDSYQIAQVDLFNSSVRLLGEKQKFIWLEQAQGNQIYFFTGPERWHVAGLNVVEKDY